MGCFYQRLLLSLSLQIGIQFCWGRPTIVVAVVLQQGCSYQFIGFSFFVCTLSSYIVVEIGIHPFMRKPSPSDETVRGNTNSALV